MSICSMSTCSRLSLAGILAGGLCLLILAHAGAQQALQPPPARLQNVPGTAKTVTTRVPVMVPRPAAEGGGWKTEYREMQYTATPDQTKLQAAEMEAASDAQRLVAQLAQAPEPQRDELKEKLREALSRQFEAQQNRRSEEITGIEERLARLKETLQKRNAAKEAIIGRRLDQLMGVKDELAWEETGPAAIETRFGTTTIPAVPVYPGAGTFVTPPNVPRTAPAWAPAPPDQDARPRLSIPALNSPESPVEPALPPPPPPAAVAPPAGPPPLAPRSAPAAEPAPAALPAPAAPEPPR